MPQGTTTRAALAAVSSFGGAPLYVVPREPEQLNLFGFGGGVDLVALRKRRAELAAHAQAENTRRGYASDWGIFETWCERAGRAPLAATSDTVQLYLVGLAARGLLPATMERHAAAIAARHAAAGFRSPVDVDVREVLMGLRRELGAAHPHAKAALSIDDLRVMLARLPEDARGARDRALLLVGFASGLRRSEVAALDLADVRFERRGVLLLLDRCKTDQEGKGRCVGVHKGKHRETCPVRALRAWLVERGAWPGALFCFIDSHGALVRRHMTGQAVNTAVKSAARAAGLDVARIGAHSLRAGLVTAAGSNGVGTLAIMARTGHHDAKIVQAYMRPQTALAVDPLAGLL
jgi:site-specific recombinase XerD